MSKKILIISQHFYPEIGSAGNRMTNIYQLLIKDNHEVDMITVDPSYPNKEIYNKKKFWDNDELNKPQDNIIRIRPKKQKHSQSMFKRLLFFLEVMLKIMRVISKNKKQYDYIYVSTPPIFIAIVGLFAKHRLKTKLILEVRDLWPESLKGVKVFDSKLIIQFFGLIEKRLYKKADVIIVNSLGFVEHIKKKSKVSSDKIHYLPNAARAYELKEPNQASNEFKVIYSGNIGLAQDIEFLKELAIKLDENKMKLTIIGYGVKANELEQLIEEDRLDYITFINPLSRKQCLTEIREHHVGIVSLNDKEVFDTVLPGKVVDYMTCNIPIVGSVSGYTKEIITKNHIGYASENREVEEIYQYIKHLYDHPEEYHQMVKNCKTSIERDFLWEKNIKVLDEIFQESV